MSRIKFVGKLIFDDGERIIEGEMSADEILAELSVASEKEQITRPAGESAATPAYTGEAGMESRAAAAPQVSSAEKTIGTVPTQHRDGEAQRCPEPAVAAASEKALTPQRDERSQAQIDADLKRYHERYGVGQQGGTPLGDGVRRTPATEPEEGFNSHHPSPSSLPSADGATTYEARLFAERQHELYERLAPSFGYVTREDTRRFDPESANGRLMVAVWKEMIEEARRCGSSLFSSEAEKSDSAETLTAEEIKTLCNRYWHPTRSDAFDDLPSLILEVYARGQSAAPAGEVATERRQGHTALRVRNGELEVFDKHPPQDVAAAATAWIRRCQVLPVLPPNGEEGFRAGAAWALSLQSAKEGKTETGWLIENGESYPEIRYRTINSGVPTWTANASEAIRFARRIDAEMFCAEDDEAWRVAEHQWG